MNLGILVAIILPFAFIILSVLIVDSDWVKSSWYDDAKETDYIPEKKRLINQIGKEANDKRADYLFCVRNIYVIGSNNILNYMRKIDEYLTSYKLEQFDRFYTVYCKELRDTLEKINKCKCSSLYYSLVTEARGTYGSIFSKMVTDVEAAIKNNTSSDTDIEGIKNFAKINGDFDENYKEEATTKSKSNTDEVLTSTTSAVENSTKYAEALVRAYEKVSEYKKENARLAKELERCKAEAKKRNDTSNANDKLKSDLSRLDEVIHCQERAGRNDATLELMRKVRGEVVKTAIMYGKDNYTDYKLYYWGVELEDYLKDWESEFDYTHDYTDYDESDGIRYESL